jgi:hypothetical protein
MKDRIVKYSDECKVSRPFDGSLDGPTMWIADGHRGDGKRFVVRANEKLIAFVELESAIRER